jgi:hypothetical protein
MANRVTYELAEVPWRSDSVVVKDPSGQRLCSVPLKFLADSKVDPIALLCALVRMCVVEDGSLVDQAGTGITDAAQISRGTLVWRCAGELAAVYVL